MQSHSTAFEVNYLERRGAVVEWFGGDHLSDSAASIAHDAFTRAKAQVLAEGPKEEHQKILANQHVSMEQFKSTLADAQEQYQAKHTSKAFKWLHELSTRVMHYGVVLDVLVQHHPEYVSLIWGAFRFMFSGVVNHEEMVTNLAKACSMLADSLPQARLGLILYPTSAMREAVALLYAAIVKFTMNALTWYRKNRFMRAIHSLTHPWALSFDDQLREVQRHSQRIEQLARAASYAELRELHFKIHENRSDWQLVRNDIAKLHSVIETEKAFLRAKPLAGENKSVQQHISLDMSGLRESICQIQLGQILSLSCMKGLPISDQSLAYCRSLLARKCHARQTELPSLNALQMWNNQPDLSVVVTQSSNPDDAKHLLVTLIQFLQRQEIPLLWALRPSILEHSSLTTLDVVRALLYQALQLNPSAMDSSYPITMEHLCEAAGLADWLLLLKRALQGLATAFILFDADLVDSVTNKDPIAAKEFLVEFTRIIGPETAKLIVSSRSFGAQQAENELGSKAKFVPAMASSDSDREQDNFSSVSWSEHADGVAAMPRQQTGGSEGGAAPSTGKVGLPHDAAGDGHILDCTVGTPIKENDGSKDAFVSYLITTHSTFPSFQREDTNVRRRFTDFVFLSKQLMRDFPATAVPPLPDKQRMEYVRGDRFGSDFTSRRAHSLQRFLVRLSLHPVLRRAPILHNFLESPDWNATVRSKTTRSSVQSDPNGSSGVFDNFADTFINAFTKVHRPDKRFIEVKDRSDKLDEDLNHIEKVVARVVRRETDLETDMRDLAEQFQKLITLEPGVEPAAHAFAICIEDMANNLRTLKDITDQDYLGSLRDLQAYSFALKNLLRALDHGAGPSAVGPHILWAWRFFPLQARGCTRC
ncbi:hypothetical protein NLG97_g6728 [Lecanicillium saksenae]|uniref:Uncharacterized protein n=1 Tax=Lecanicillium saksenae TaxID=468837 RepID=A0ACC1QNU3_9HYPO|nr:hypothetical protein NLG97_g6728 [Lecanicillium saksenae]